MWCVVSQLVALAVANICIFLSPIIMLILVGFRLLPKTLRSRALSCVGLLPDAPADQDGNDAQSTVLGADGDVDSRGLLGEADARGRSNTDASHVDGDNESRTRANTDADEPEWLASPLPPVLENYSGTAEKDVTHIELSSSVTRPVSWSTSLA